MTHIRLLCASVLLTLTLPSLHAVDIATLKKRIEERRKQLNKSGTNAKEVIRSIRSQATPIKAKRRAAADAHAKADKRLQDGKKQYELIAGKLEEMKRELAKMADEVTKIKDEREKADASLKQMDNESVKVLTQRKQDIQKQIDALNKDMTEIKQQAVMGSEIDIAKKATEDAQKELDNLEKIIAELDKAILDASTGT